MGKLFGTDGIRGVANMYPMTPDMMVKLGQVLGSTLQNSVSGVLIGRDSRRSGPMLEAALSAGLLASGVNVQLAGVLPTPAIAYLTRTLQLSAGIVLSASHNPAQDNGVKVFSSDGYKLSDALERNIEDAVLEGCSLTERPTGAAIGQLQTFSDAVERYVENAVQSVFGSEISDTKGLKVVLDCANGAASKAAPLAFQQLGFSPVVLSAKPDGLNINAQCGALHTEALQQHVKEEGADVGFAFDGDADRLILVDEHGQQVDGDRILAMLALDLLQRNQLHQQTLVVTVMSNLGLEVAMTEAGINIVRSAVGDRHVVEKMRALGANLGGEQSGHVVMFDHGTTGDGLVTALSILKLLLTSGKSVSDLAACMTTFPQTLLNVPIKARTPIEDMVGVSQAIHQAEQELGQRGRVLVRYSGTELLARVMVEAEALEVVHRIAEIIAEEIRKEGISQN
jgi:phosphoglucosamine mutase